MNSYFLKRYVPLAVWIVAVFTIIAIPLKIIGYGFLPMDDALRHAAKAVSGKSWQQILVMRDDFQIDPSPGWQAILAWVHNWQNCSAESLVVFSVVALMLLVTLSALPWLRRPEAWLAALFAAAIFIPACTTRFARGRPYLLTDAVLITILFLWSRQSEDRPRRAALIFTPLLVAASAWIHGSWYLLCLPGAAILFAGFWRSAFCYGGCWLAGSFLGCALTGHPWEFLFQSVRHMFGAFGHFVVNRQLEPEWYPSDGEIPAVLAVVVLLLCRKIFLGWNPRALLNPSFHDDGFGLAARTEDAPVLVGFRHARVHGLGRAGIAGAFRESSFVRFGQAPACHAGNCRRSFSRIHQRPRQPLDGKSHDGISHARNARHRRLAAR